VLSGDILAVANEVGRNRVLLVQPYKKKHKTTPKYGDENDSENGILDVHVKIFAQYDLGSLAMWIRGNFNVNPSSARSV
jgi:hypothetical protein